jgi:hypothetical protein
MAGCINLASKKSLVMVSILINSDGRNQIRIDEPAVILQLVSERDRERLVLLLCYMVGLTLSRICSLPKKVSKDSIWLHACTVHERRNWR